MPAIRLGKFQTAAAIAVILVSGCQRKAAPAPSTDQVNAAAEVASISNAVDMDAGDSSLLAAAEPFETLTETAFAASPTELEGNIGKAERAAQSVRDRLPTAAVQRMAARLAEIKAGAAHNARADVAIAAVEGYRILVSSVSHAGRIPTEVNLLDYAGFRYTADLKAKPVRWADMAAAATFARNKWDMIAAQVGDTQLRSKFQSAVDGLRTGVDTQDAAAAAKTASAELDLVDMLENYFEKRPAR